jgi:hypothetical protein
VVCQYTVSNISNFYFDDFYFGPPVLDTVPPAVVSVTATGPAGLDVLFSESVDSATAVALSNYGVDNGIGQPATALWGPNPAAVHLTFGNSFQSGTAYMLSVMNVEDPAGNAMQPAAVPFAWAAPVTADPFDVVFSEVFFQFADPQGLPKAEYIELYNRSPKAFDLAGWTIEDATGTPAALPSAVLSPGGYLILCHANNVSLLAPYGAVAGVASFPGLNDDGDDLVLRDNTAAAIESLSYDASHYNDPLRDGGGFSIERIDAQFACPNRLNWKASQSALGGTPGQPNTVSGVFSDNEPPRLARAFLSGADRLTAVFSETMSASLSAAPNYSVSGGFGTPASVTVLSASKVELQFGMPFDSATVYTLTAGPSLTDCPGLALSKNTASFRVPEAAAVSDVLFNEVLYDPYDGGSEFIEIYNRSQKVIDLGALRLYEVDLVDQTLEVPLVISAEPWLLFPGAFAVLSKDAGGIEPFYTIEAPDAFVDMAGFPGLGNDAGHVALTDLNTVLIDQFYYNIDNQIHLLNEDKGV